MTKIIAEAGVNHNGSLAKAKKLIDVASRVGANYVKFQTFEAEDLVTKSAPKAMYQKSEGLKKESQFCMLKKLELSKKNHLILKKYCIKKKIIFLSSPFSIKSFNFLIKIGLKTIKIPSGEINNIPFLKHVGRFKKKLILSTGMASLSEIELAIKTLVNSGTPKKNLTILHCNSEYPSPLRDINLRAMLTIKKKLGVKIGYSDHSLGNTVPIAAAALGASLIEKHFTLNKNLKGPDHKASANPIELQNIIQKVREVEKILGSHIKKPTKSEIKNIKIIRKSIVAKINIKKGEKFTNKNLILKRPGNGISPNKLSFLIGKRAKKNYTADQIIKL